MTKRIFMFALAAAGLLTADTLALHNGQRFYGTYAGGDSRTIRFTVGNQVNTYNLNDVDSIAFSSSQSANSRSNGGYPQYAPPPPAPPAYGSPAPPQPPPPEAPQPPSSGPDGIEVPAGTQVVVRLIDPVDSQQDSLGQTFRASVDQPVIVNGE